jgi:hypothetical protein
LTLKELMECTYLMGGFTTRGNTARSHAELIAEGAVRGFLTTQTPDGEFGHIWRLTALGVHELGLKAPHLKDIK